jgi:hypothetical protein
LNRAIDVPLESLPRIDEHSVSTKERTYRALVIGTRGHVLVARRLLSAVKRRAERA